MQYLYRLCLFFLIPMLILSCSTEGGKQAAQPFSDCPYGSPKAIFSAELPGVEKHQFELSAQQAREKVQFGEGPVLELIQSGCEKPRQEFQFSLPVSTSGFTDKDWLDLSLELFAMMGNLHESLQPFLLWRSALLPRVDEMKLGLPLELEPGFFVRIDKVSQSDSGLLILTLYQE